MRWTKTQTESLLVYTATRGEWTVKVITRDMRAGNAWRSREWTCRMWLGAQPMSEATVIAPVWGAKRWAKEALMEHAP